MKPRRFLKRKIQSGRHASGSFFSNPAAQGPTFFQGTAEAGAIHRSDSQPSAGFGLRSQELQAHPVFLSVLSGQALLRRGYPDSTAVRILQSLLQGVGHDPGPIDGIWGAMTSGALIAFQLAQGLLVDGILGPQTLMSLDGAIADKPNGKPLPEPPDLGELETLLTRIGKAKLPDAQFLADIGELLTLIGLPTADTANLLKLKDKLDESAETDALSGIIAALIRARESVSGPGGEKPPGSIQQIQIQLVKLDMKSSKQPNPELRAWLYFHSAMFGNIAVFRGWRTEFQAGRKVNQTAWAAAMFAVQHVGKVEAPIRASNGERRDKDLLHGIFNTACHPDYYDTDLRNAVKFARFQLPHWCGIFTNYACLSVGAPQNKWNGEKKDNPNTVFTNWSEHDLKEKPNLKFGRLPPRPGDVITFPKPDNHFALCLEYESKNDLITTIDGNVKGGKIMVQRRHRTKAEGFYRLP